MKARLIALFVMSSLMYCGCGGTSGYAVSDSRELNDEYRLANVEDGRFCVTRHPRGDLLCQSSISCSEIGRARDLIAVRIDVPSKEYLLIDTAKGYIWVLDREQFNRSPQTQGIEMLPAEKVWSALGIAGA